MSVTVFFFEKDDLLCESRMVSLSFKQEGERVRSGWRGMVWNEGKSDDSKTASDKQTRQARAHQSRKEKSQSSAEFSPSSNHHSKRKSSHIHSSAPPIYRMPNANAVTSRAGIATSRWASAPPLSSFPMIARR
jgi:uncharacterized protein YdaU (DUF1376 family)